MRTILIASSVALVGWTGVALALSGSRILLLGSPRRTHIQSVEYVITWKILNAPADTKISGSYQIGKKRPDGSLYPVSHNFSKLKSPVQIRFYIEPAIPVQAGIHYFSSNAGTPYVSIHRNGKLCNQGTAMRGSSIDVSCFKSY